MRKIQCFLLVFFMLFGLNVYAVDVKVSLALLPPVINKDKSGLLADLIRLMDKAQTRDSFEIVGVYPFGRSMYNVGKKADLHWPSLEKPGGMKNLDIMYSTETFYKVNFVLYSKKGSGVRTDNLSNFKIGTQRGQKEYFPFPVEEINNLENGLKMVDVGRLDGLIFSMLETDLALEKTGLKTIDRTLYGKINVKMVLPDNDRGRLVDQSITESMKVIRKNGKYEELMGFLINAEFKK